MNEWSDIAVVTPPGDIDIASVPRLRDRVDGLVAHGVRRIVINCQAVSFIDSTGLAFLLSRARRLMRVEGLLTLVNASTAIMRFLEIARLVDILHASSADRAQVPVLDPSESPRWSKSVSVLEGVENLAHYRHRVAALLEKLPLTREARYDMALATSEALGNAYDHATGCRCVLTVLAYGDRVVIEVTDEGVGYAIAVDEDPRVSEERGRGIKLMRMLVDSVDVSRRPGGKGTQVQLVKLYDDRG